MLCKSVQVCEPRISDVGGESELGEGEERD